MAMEMGVEQIGAVWSPSPPYRGTPYRARGGRVRPFAGITDGVLDSRPRSGQGRLFAGMTTLRCAPSTGSG